MTIRNVMRVMLSTFLRTFLDPSSSFAKVQGPLQKSFSHLEFFKMINVKVEFWVAPNTQCSFKVKIIFDSESSESI